MSINGRGPAPTPFDGFGLRELPPWNAHAPTFAQACVLDHIYSRCGKGRVSEIYVHGYSVLEGLQRALAHGRFEGEDRTLVLSVVMLLWERGDLQARGPYAWAMTTHGSAFVTQPGVLPTRAWFLERDCHRCRYCGEAGAASAPLHLDHVFPKSRGGWDDAANVVTACQRCNCRKNNRTPCEWRRADPQNAGWL